jgi:hypothetical protein
VNDVVLVTISNGLEELLDDFSGVDLAIVAFVLDFIKQLAALQIVDYEVDVALGLIDAMKLDNAGMVKSPQDPDLIGHSLLLTAFETRTSILCRAFRAAFETDFKAKHTPRSLLTHEYTLA